MTKRYYPGTIGAIAAFMLIVCVSGAAQDIRPRLRDIGVSVGIFSPGTLNAITDVSGVRVGHVTVDDGASVHTGVTAIVPHAGNLFAEKVPAAIVVGNGFGKLIGVTQVEELGQIETPVLLTNTLSVWDVARATARYMMSLPGNEDVRSVSPVVGETNDGFLNDIRSMRVTEDDVHRAIREAKSGVVDEGSVGAGRGTVSFGWKGGIGTSSRVLPVSLGGYTVGALVQTNYGGILEIAGVPIGLELGRYAFQRQLEQQDGSCMIVLATDAPLDPHQLKRMARRALLSLGRSGSAMYNGSGDYVIAFSTEPAVRITGTMRDTIPRLSTDAMSPIFQATLESVEEAIYNSLLRATPVVGREGRRVDAIDVEAVKRLMGKYGRGMDR